MTEQERAEARAVSPGIGREMVQTFYLMGLMAAALSSVLGLGLLAARILG